MSTAKVSYLGQLRTKNEHLGSGATYFTDAPMYNHGKGEAFSPTDTVATALANCMLTVMGVKARDHDISIDGATASVTKVMASDPRRIDRIEVLLSMPPIENRKHRTILENSARTCPVLYSLHPEIKKEITFDWGK